jgi:hypothetical protein
MFPGFFSFLAGFLTSPWMLLGLAVLAIPPIIHLLNRRRYDVVEWGAMQFLQVSEVTRRRILIEELLLMLLRMGLLAVLVLALAGPFLSGALATRLAGRPNRDVVLLIDGSASMAAINEAGTQTPFAVAREWVGNYLQDLVPGDGVAIFQVREQVVPVVGELSADFGRARAKLDNLSAPAGSCNWQEAIKKAHAVLAESKRGDRQILILSDGQKFGWADPDNLFRWELLAGELGTNRPDPPGSPPRPRIQVVNLAAELFPHEAGKADAEPIPNWALTPLRCNRPVVPVDREVTFQTDIVLIGQKGWSNPWKIRLEVDGTPVRDLAPPRDPKIDNGKVPFSFTHRFGKPGSHLITLILEADPPAEDRPRGYVLKDRVPGDNRQDYAVEVVTALPVLLVDGDPSAAPPLHRGTDFLRDALSPARDRTPVVQARVVSLQEFVPALLTGEQKPRVLILSNVPRLDPQQQEAITRFLAEGGGLLITLGERVEADRYNEELYRGGDGWLPARLDGIEGDEARPRESARPDPATFSHPALELFRTLPVGGLAEARFPRWWKLTTPGKHAPGVTVGLLRSPTAAWPFLIERAFQAGRVLLCSVPLDNSNGTNLPDLPAFVPLAHELVYYLAGARSAEFNLRPGQPIRYRLESEAALEQFRLRPPSGDERPLGLPPAPASAWPAQLLAQERGALLVFDGARETGVWRLTLPDHSTTIYYVVQGDARESDLTPSSDEERDQVAKLVPLSYENDRKQVQQTAPGTEIRQELWLYLLLGMIALLCGEVWLTRRMVKNR